MKVEESGIPKGKLHSQGMGKMAAIRTAGLSGENKLQIGLEQSSREMTSSSMELL